MNWLPDEDAKLRELWEAGFSTSKIAKQVLGKTKNAVIGRAHRLGLPSRDSPIVSDMPPEEAERRRAESRRARRCRWEAKMRERGTPYLRPKRRSLPVPVQRDPEPVRQDTAAQERYAPAVTPPPYARTCQWIDGEPSGEDSCKCGAAVFAAAYCVDHYRRAHNSRLTAASMAKAAEYTPRDMAKQVGRMP